MIRLISEVEGGWPVRASQLYRPTNDQLNWCHSYVAMYYTVCSRLVLVHPSWMDQIGTGFWLMSALQQRLSRARFGGAGWLVGPDMYIGRIQRADGRTQQGAAGSGSTPAVSRTRSTRSTVIHRSLERDCDPKVKEDYSLMTTPSFYF